MNKTELQYYFPENLIAKEPQRPSRICSALEDVASSLQASFSTLDETKKSSSSDEANFFPPSDLLLQPSQSSISSPLISAQSLQRVSVQDTNQNESNQEETKREETSCREVNWTEFLSFFQEGDVLVLNDTKVLKRRVFTSEGLEVLFLGSEDRVHWNVLFPSRRYALGSEILLPGEVRMTLLEKGRPQKVKTNFALAETYFETYGELPLPPYIQKAREQRHTHDSDESWYQTQWSERPGSFAAPTASLHFTQAHLEQLKARSVRICFLTLHVGLGTFLPVEVEDLKQHVMHHESVEIPSSVLSEIEQAQSNSRQVWAMGTTVMRALESYGQGLLAFDSQKSAFVGNTDLLILPGFQFKMVDRLLTNFHQPESTLLALVMAFAGIEKVKLTYQWAIKNKFRLFSYGDLSVWQRRHH